MIYLFDIDGTLTDTSKRLHYISGETKDWAAFYANAAHDTPIWETITIARALHNAGQRIFMSTGRPESTRGLTMAWMSKYRVPVEVLYMRTDNDHREDYVVKSELLDQIILHNPPSVLYNSIGGAFEDRQQVVDMYRSRGLRVYQVAPGNF